MTLNAARDYIAVVWSPNGTLKVLPAVTAGDPSTASAINNRNVIVGFSAGKAVRWRGAVGVPCTIKPFC